MGILGKKRAVKLTGFHRVMLLLNLTGLDTLTKVYQINWKQPKIALGELLHSNLLVTSFITSFILCVLLLLDYIIHNLQRKRHIEANSVAMNNVLVILFYVNSVAIFVAYMSAASKMDQGTEASNMDQEKKASTTFIRVTSIYIAPSLLFIIHFFFSLSCYLGGDPLKEVKEKTAEMRQKNKDASRLIFKAKVKSFVGCNIM